ncbi:MAG: PP2C family protein-serine/threonine phosphatase [Clostridiales bacterium]|nr:PP2C family protein-serine/threonine phosphatase [Clostridiales bacterium]
MISSSRLKTATLLAVLYSVIMVSLSIYFYITEGFGRISETSTINIVQDIFCIVLAFVLFICAIIGTPQKGRSLDYFLLMLFTNINASFTDEIAWLVDGRPEYIPINIATNTIFYICNVLMAFFFWKYVTSFLDLTSDRLGIWPKLFTGGAIFSVALILMNLFTGIYFTVDAEGVYHRSDYYMISNVYIYLSMALTLVLVVLARKRLKKYQIIILFMYVFLPLATGLVAVFSYGTTLTNAASIIVLLLMYCVLHVIQSREQFVAESELATATAIQKNILPRIFPPYPDKTEFELFASMTPAKEVGGDLYDYFLADDNHLIIIIADVSGKGVPAALFMMVVKTLLKNQSINNFNSAAEIFYKVNNQLCEGNELDMFATAWLGVLELSSGTLSYATAGHEYVTLKKKDGKFAIIKERNSPPLAVMENMHYKEYELRLDPGDIIWLYTDGVPEASNSRGEMFGLDRMLESLNKHCSGTMKELDAGVREDIAAFTTGADPFDDITTLCVRYNGPVK